MIEKSSQYQQNVKGLFYVDAQCIGCDACTLEAPLFFKMNDEAAHAFVVKQPKNERERNICLKAMNICPVGAIGDDGTKEF